jgi:hypothetical protein
MFSSGKSFYSENGVAVGLACNFCCRRIDTVLPLVKLLNEHE